MTVLQMPLRPHHAGQIPDGHIGAPELTARAGITYRQTDYWTRTGLLRPLHPEPGTGYAHCYPIAELAVATLMRRLLDGGLNLRPAHAAARALLDTGTTRIADITIHLPEEL